MLGTSEDRRAGSSRRPRPGRARLNADGARARPVEVRRDAGRRRFEVWCDGYTFRARRRRREPRARSSPRSTSFATSSSRLLARRGDAIRELARDRVLAAARPHRDGAAERRVGDELDVGARHEPELAEVAQQVGVPVGNARDRCALRRARDRGGCDGRPARHGARDRESGRRADRGSGIRARRRSSPRAPRRARARAAPPPRAPRPSDSPSRSTR